MASSADKVSFTGSLGETLAARLDKPAGPPRAYALFAHCFSCSKDIYAAARIAKQLAELSMRRRLCWPDLPASEMLVPETMRMLRYAMRSTLARYRARACSCQVRASASLVGTVIETI